MASPLRFSILARSRICQARLGRVETPHGGFDTPAFMPVGTRASVKGLLPDQVRGTGAQIILNNAYHLMLRPGADLVDRLGGVHRFMRWDGPILTDSGGYQAFSMADINSLDDDGVTFSSIVDGAKVRLTPETSIEAQNRLGADIIMAFDDCAPAVQGSPVLPQACSARDHGRLEEETSNGATAVRSSLSPGDAVPRRRREALERTTRWLHRCVRAHARRDEQALFGIVQGGTDPELRTVSAAQVCGFDLPGFAIGGVAVGEPPDLVHSIVAHTAPLLPWEKPRYLMGVGYERDIVQAVQAGVDMFDCVLPTRNGRNANAFTRLGRLHLRNARWRDDPRPVEENCDCAACAAGFSRGYLRHLFMAGEMLGPVLLSLHNLRHFQRLLLDIRSAIREDDWPSLDRGWPVLAAAQRPITGV